MSIDTFGRSCTRCGEKKEWSEFYNLRRGINGKTPACKTCMAALADKYRSENRDQVRKRGKESKKRKRAEDPQPDRDANRRWRLANKNKISIKQKKYYENNKERLREAVRKYNAQHAAEAKAWQQNYRARKRAGGSITGNDMRRVLTESALCFYCESPYTADRRPTVDHVVPLSKGGTNDLSNLVSCCRSCNSKKRARTLEEWEPAIGKNRLLEKMATRLAPQNIAR